MTPPRTPWALTCAPPTTYASTLVMIVGLCFPFDHWFGIRLFCAGLATAMLSATAWMLAKTSATEQQIEIVRQHAYDEGYADGCEVARVTQLRRRSASTSPMLPVLVTKDCPAQEFGDQDDIGSTA